VAAPTLRGLPVIDTLTDIPFASEPDSRKLKYLAGDHGFLNPFAHRAVFDVLTMLKVLSHYPIDKVLEYAKAPMITIRAVVDFNNKDKAKARRFSWEKIGDKTYPKMWVKRIKEFQLEEEKKAMAPFQVGVLERG
jgi:DNA polymerase III subunit epsilon